MKEFNLENIQAFWLGAGLQLVNALLLVVLGLLATKLIIHIMSKAMKRTSVDDSLIGFFRRCVRVACYVIIIISALSMLGISTTGIIAGFSAAAAALALALKDSLSDIASGIVILFTRPFVTGDFIKFGEHEGFVQKIDMMHTKIRTYSGTDIVIPNSKVTSAEVDNYTANPQIRVQIFIPVSYSADIDKVEEVIRGVLDKAEHVIRGDDAHKPMVRLDQFGDSALVYVCRAWTDFPNYWNVYYDLNETIKKKLDENGLTIPFNQLDVHIDK